MANAGGGLIVWGVAEMKDASSARRYVGKLSPIPDGVVDESQVRRTLREWLFPTWLDLNFRSRSLAGGGSIVVLDVPRPLTERLPYLVVREWPPSKKAKGASRGHFTMYRRSGTDNVHVPPEEMYRWVHAGYHAFAAPGPIDSGGTAPGTGTLLSYGTAVPPPSASEALAEEVQALGIPDGDLYYFIQLAPQGSARLNNFFGDRQESLQQKLGRVEKTRDIGFSCFSRYAHPERTPSNGLRLGLEQKAGVYVLPTGLTTFVCAKRTLTWASDKHAPPGRLIVNPVALPEFTLEACRFFIRDVLPRAEESRRACLWRTGMSGLGETGTVHLPKGMLGDVPLRAFWDEERPHTARDFVTEFVSDSEADSDRLAFVVLEEVFHHFGYASDAIPFQKDGRVDAAAIATL